MLRRWQSTGSPTAAVAEEKLGSFRVHCRRVPAGRTTLCALALRVKPSNRVARVAQNTYFITPPQSHAPSFFLGAAEHALVTAKFVTGLGGGQRGELLDHAGLHSVAY